MNAANQSNSSQEEGSWAPTVQQMNVQDIPAGAVNLNVQGRRPMSPLQGFGQLWQKTYTIRLDGAEITPAAVISDWKAHFPEYWPEGNNFYGPSQGIESGEVAVLNLPVPGRMFLSTGVRVIYTDDVSFSFMTPQGHMFAGMITFSAEDDNGVTVIQIQALIRASDPLFETTFRLGFGHKTEDAFWLATLRNLATHFGAPASEPDLKMVCVDKKVQWSEAGNIRYNSAIRSAVYMPVYFTKRLFGRA